MLQLAEKHDLVIIEDDIYGDFDFSQQSRFARLDQLQRVIDIGSYSKTLSAAMGVGYIACKHELMQQSQAVSVRNKFQMSLMLYQSGQNVRCSHAG